MLLLAAGNHSHRVQRAGQGESCTLILASRSRGPLILCTIVHYSEVLLYKIAMYACTYLPPAPASSKLRNVRVFVCLSRVCVCACVFRWTQRGLQETTRERAATHVLRWGSVLPPSSSGCSSSLGTASMSASTSASKRTTHTTQINL